MRNPPVPYKHANQRHLDYGKSGDSSMLSKSNARQNLAEGGPALTSADYARYYGINGKLDTPEALSGALQKVELENKLAAALTNRTGGGASSSAPAQATMPTPQAPSLPTPQMPDLPSPGPAKPIAAADNPSIQALGDHSNRPGFGARTVAAPPPPLPTRA